jgi:glycosyltransferase involved in cell wall biosynthesis
MKHIAIIIGNITRTGGTERATVNLANMLIDLEYHVSIVSLSGSESEGSFYPLNKNVQQIYLQMQNAPQHWLDKPLYYFRFVKRLNKVLKQYAFDIAIGTGHAINSLLVLIKPLQCKAIVCEHIDYNALPFFSNTFRRIIYRRANKVVVLTKNAENCFTFAKVVRIPNALPFMPQENPNIERQKIMLSVGRLSKEKGFDRLLLIAAKLKSVAPDWKIRIVGDGDMKNELLEQQQKLGLTDFVEWKPFTQNIVEEYLNSSIYIHASYTEAFPMVLLEAKSCGLPVVCFDYGSGEDIITDAVDGFLVKDGDMDSFVSKVRCLTSDVELRTSMANAARKSVAPYLPENIGKEWDKMIKEL